MILLLGGTGETAAIAAALAGAGYALLVSTATDAPLALPRHPLVSRRTGRLDAGGLLALLRERDVSAVVDATHPYAVAVQDNAREAARAAGVPHLRWQRAETDAVDLGDALVAAGHEEAARLAFSYGRNVLLTVGSRNVAPYICEARRCGLRVMARILPLAESWDACRRAGLAEVDIIAARGPFSVADNRLAIRGADAGVLVTKESGVEGGVPAKLEAARLEGCAVVVVRRPLRGDERTVRSIEELLAALRPR